MANWYYSRGNQQLGPVESHGLQTMLQRGEVLPTELVWTEGMAKWTPAAQVAALRTVAPPPQFAPSAPMPPNMAPPLGYQYPPSPYGYAGNQPVDETGKATTALVLGVVSLVAWFCPIVGFGVSITGPVMGSKGKQSSARGQAIAGIVLNTIGLILTIINAAWGAYLGAQGKLFRH
jgi:hypothetical protein